MCPPLTKLDGGTTGIAYNPPGSKKVPGLGILEVIVNSGNTQALPKNIHRIKLPFPFLLITLRMPDQSCQHFPWR